MKGRRASEGKGESAREYDSKVSKSFGKRETFPNIGQDMIKIPERLRSKANNIDEFCNEIFPDIKNVVKDGLNKSFNDDEWISWITSRAIICPINEDCEEINEKMIKITNYFVNY